MYLVSPIRNALQSIREDLLELTSAKSVVYDSAPLISIIERVIDIVEKNGIPDIKAEEVRPTTATSSKYFNDISSSVVRTLVTITNCIGELVNAANKSANVFNDKFNTLEPFMQDLRARLVDLESQVLENASNKSISEHEIKVIDFRKNWLKHDITSLANNTIMLTVTQQQQIKVDDNNIVIYESIPAQNYLNNKFSSTIERSDNQTIQGTYFGNIIGKLNGNEVFKAESETSIDDLYSNTINEKVDINYYSFNRIDKLSVGIDHIFNNPIEFNLLEITSNVPSICKIELEGQKQGIELRRNIYPILTKAKSITTSFKQENPSILNYDGINIVDRRSGAIVKKYNYFSSLKHIFPETFNKLNSSIETSDVVAQPGQEIKIVKRDGAFKYPISIENINIYLNQYTLKGTWESAAITTNDEIDSIDFETEQYIPDDEMEYLLYQISFDQNDWYDIKPSNEGLTSFNKERKSRLVIGNVVLNNDFKYIPRTDSIGKRFYLRVNLETNNAKKSPIIYNLKVRVKVNKDAQ